MATKEARETTSLTKNEADALGDVAEVAGLTRSALLRLLVLDGLRRYAPAGHLHGAVDHEARVARVRLSGIAPDVAASA